MNNQELLDRIGEMLKRRAEADLKIIDMLAGQQPAPKSKKLEAEPEPPQQDKPKPRRKAAPKPSITLEDLRLAFLDLRQAVGAPAAKAVVTDICPNAKNLNDIPEDLYEDLHAAMRAETGE